MRRKVAEVLSLTLVWAVLWSDLDLATLTSGVVVCVVILWLVPPSTFGRVGRLHPGRTLALVFSTLGRLVTANVVVAREALTGGSSIEEAIIEVDIGDVSEELATLIAVSVSLAPGTVTVDVRPGLIYVHVLHATDIEGARRNLHDLAERVKRLRVEAPEGS